MKKLDEKDMPLLNRKRINFEVEFSGPTPSENEVIKSIASMLKSKEELIAIRHIYQKYGLNKAKVIAHIYRDVKDKNIFEPKRKIKETKKQEDKKQEETVAQNDKEKKKE